MHDTLATILVVLIVHGSSDYVTQAKRKIGTKIIFGNLIKLTIDDDGSKFLEPTSHAHRILSYYSSMRTMGILDNQ